MNPCFLCLRLTATDVEALQRVPVPGRVIAAAVDGSRHCRDAEVAVVHGNVAGHRRRLEAGGGPEQLDAVVQTVAESVVIDHRAEPDAAGLGADRDAPSGAV